MDGQKLTEVLRNLLEREGQFSNAENIVSKLQSLDHLQLYNVLNGLQP